MGWELSHYQHLAKDEETQIELEPRGSMSRDYQGSRRSKKRNSKRSSKKSAKKKERDREREDAGVGFIAGGLPPAGETADIHPQVRGVGFCTSASWEYLVSVIGMLLCYCLSML